MKTTPYIDPQRFRSQATGGGATQHEAREAGDWRQYKVAAGAAPADLARMCKDKGRITPNPVPLAGHADFVDSSQFGY